MQDIGDISEEYPNKWAILCNKGYQSAVEFLPIVTPYKKAHRELSVSETVFNERISSERLLAENVFGRLCGLRSITSNNFCWQEKSYDALFRICLDLTNSILKWNPLLDGDGGVNHRIKSRLSHIGVTIRERHQEAQKRFLGNAVSVWQRRLLIEMQIPFNCLTFRRPTHKRQTEKELMRQLFSH